MYLKPETKEFQIVAQQTLMAGSTMQVSSENYDEDTMTDLSRSGRFYDDEEE